ncbi:TPA: hypothetical protein ACGADT_004079 [Salmonella enterica subsp. enterica serovar Newport]
MQRIDEVLEKTLAHIGRGDTAEQRRRNQQNIVRIRKMIDAARYNEKIKRLV